MNRVIFERLKAMYELGKISEKQINKAAEKGLISGDGATKILTEG